MVTTTGHAQETQISIRGGALGFGSQSGLGYGASFLVIPYGWAGFIVDLSSAIVDGDAYFSSSPSLVLYPLAYEEVRAGVLFGGGFYKLPAQSMKFGLDFGLLGDFALSNNMSVGMEMRNHYVFNSADAWNIFLTWGWKFDGDGGW